jgi:asparagine synthase (glutamine-hydrolysing)
MLLRDTDQMSMAHGLEVRVPFLDHRLVELLFRIPGRWKVSKTEPKPLLTHSLNSALPAECVYRSKMGFTLPLEKWLRGSLEGEMRESFLSPTCSTPFQPESLRTIWDDFERGRVNWSRIWGIFVLRNWLERHKVNCPTLS